MLQCGWDARTGTGIRDGADEFVTVSPYCNCHWPPRMGAGNSLLPLLPLQIPRTCWCCRQVCATWKWKPVMLWDAVMLWSEDVIMKSCRDGCELVVIAIVSPQPPLFQFLGIAATNDDGVVPITTDQPLELGLWTHFWHSKCREYATDSW